MNRLCKMCVVWLALISLNAGEEIQPTAPADELSKDEIYNINVDMYCQTDLVLNEKLLDLENSVNLYASILGDDIKDIDCETVLEEYVKRVHKRLRKDFMKKGSSMLTLNCFMKQIIDLGYDKMRFRFNALYGIEIEKEKKDAFRKSIDKEIGDTVEKAVDECWPADSSKTETKSAEN